MDEELLEMLGEEIKREIRELDSLEAGSEERSRAVENVSKLYHVDIDKARVIFQSEEEALRREQELDQTETRLAEEKKDRWVNGAISAAEILIPWGLTLAITLLGFKYEETGVISSQIFRNFLSHSGPKR